MKVVFHPDFYHVYTSDPAAEKGRMEAVVKVVEPFVEFVTAEMADHTDVVSVHTAAHIDHVRRQRLYPVAMLAAGLAACKNPVIINGFSLEPQKIETILPLAKTFDADIVGFLLDTRSRVPVDLPDCLEVAGSLLAAAENAGVDLGRLIIDPVIAPLMWENGVQHNRSVIEVVGMLPDLLGFPVRTIAGLSNLTTGPGPKEKKRAAEAAFLALLAGAGLCLALVNIFHDRTTACAGACDRLLQSDIFSWEEV